MSKEKEMKKEEPKKEETKAAAPAPKEKKVAKSNEEIMMDLRKAANKDRKEGEEEKPVVLKIGEGEFVVKKVSGLEIVLCRKDYK